MAKTIFKTPLGFIGAVAGTAGVSKITLPKKRDQVELELESFLGDYGAGDEHLKQLEEEIAEYFRGRAVAFSVPLDLCSMTAFEQAVLKSCRSIPYGETMSYSELAGSIGRPNCARAVGNALGKNPVPIVIPCHRVLRKNGHLGGFGGGLDMKRKLLQLEGVLQ